MTLLTHLPMSLRTFLVRLGWALVWAYGLPALVHEATSAPGYFRIALAGFGLMIQFLANYIGPISQFYPRLAILALLLASTAITGGAYWLWGGPSAIAFTLAAAAAFSIERLLDHVPYGARSLRSTFFVQCAFVVIGVGGMILSELIGQVVVIHDQAAQVSLDRILSASIVQFERNRSIDATWQNTVRPQCRDCTLVVTQKDGRQSIWGENRPGENAAVFAATVCPLRNQHNACVQRSASDALWVLSLSASSAFALFPLALLFGLLCLVAVVVLIQQATLRLATDELRLRFASWDTAKSDSTAALTTKNSLNQAGERILRRARELVEPQQAAWLKAKRVVDAREVFFQTATDKLLGPIDEMEVELKAIERQNETLEPAHREDLTTIHSTLIQLRELLGEILDANRLAWGTLRLDYGPTDLVALLHEVQRTHEPSARKKKLTLSFTLLRPCPAIVADRKRLRRVFHNLLSNAVKFTAQGRIQILLEADANNAVINIQDTGQGIAAQELPRLFRQFVQLGPGQLAASGTGLGLAICKRIIEAHGGVLEAISEAGQGSTFRVTIPLGKSVV